MKFCKFCGEKLLPSQENFCGTECRRKYDLEMWRQGRSKKRPDGVRACHDCGRETTDYRCWRCRQRFMVKNGVPLASVDASEAYGEYSI